MALLFSLPQVAVLVLVGIGAGIQLGNGTVSSINPFYYSSMPTRTYASYASGGAVHRAGALTGEEMRSALGGCVGCRTYPEEYRPTSSLEQQMPDGYYAASLGAPRGYRTAAETGFDEPTADPDPGLADVERYSTYPVTHTERELREIRERAATQAAQDIAARQQAEMLRTAEESAARRGTEQLIY